MNDNEKYENSSDSIRIGDFVASQYVLNTNSRGNESKSSEKGKILSVLFEDKTEWFSYSDDISDIFEKSVLEKHRSLENGGIKFPNTITSQNNRNGFKNTIAKLNIYKKVQSEDNSEVFTKTEESILSEIDKKLMPKERLVTIDANFEKKDISAAEIKGNVLLFLHGTFSSFDKAFKDLKNTEAWKHLSSKYDKIIAFNHETISKSPIENAIEVLRMLPDEIDLDIISHSRGGLIADIISRYDRRNSLRGFKREEIMMLGSSLFNEEVNKDLNKKSITVNKVMKIASPSGGTSLMTKRLDHYLNFILNALIFSIGVSNPVISIIKELLLEVLSKRMNINTAPGLWAMSPDSEFQKVINNREITVKSKIYCISGDGTAGGSVKNTLFTILANLFYLNDNDWVVDTKSMKKGVMSYERGIYELLLKGSDINHFLYFRNKTVQDQLILFSDENPIFEKFEFVPKENMDRSLIDRLTYSSFVTPNATGKRPVFLIIPGIMGSTLKDEVTGERLWANLPNFFKGGFVDKLRYFSSQDDSNNEIKIFAYGAIATFYEKISDKLSKIGDVEIFPYDWREDISITSKKLEERLKEMTAFNQVTILAHSMGGLLVKELIGDSGSSWHSLMKSQNNKTIFLGTPWNGSHLILNIFSGEHSKIKMLSRIDPYHSKEEIIETVSGFPGVLQLLPLNNNGGDFDAEETWEKYCNAKEGFITPKKLNYFKDYREKNQNLKIKDKIDENTINKVFYIAGQDKFTLADIEITSTEGMEKSKLRYKYTNAGDGSTVWKYSIPKEDLPAQNIFYTSAKHENLLNEDEVFNLIVKIQANEKVDIRYNSPKIRSEKSEFRSSTYVNYSYTDEEAYKGILYENGFEEEKEQASTKDNPLIVSVFNSDIKFAHYPLMVGHFKNDGIYSAEKRLDNLLKNKLSERHAYGLYPSVIGDSEIIFQLLEQTKGGIIVGLGKQDELSGFNLAKAIELAVLKYSILYRDYESEKAYDNNPELSISTVLIGSNYAGLSINESINSIISGVKKANEKIILLDNGQKTIGQLEIVEYYEDIAQQAYKELYNEYSEDENIIIEPFKAGYGNKKRILRSDRSSWWQTFTTSAIYSKDSNVFNREVIGLTHTANSGRARIDQKTIDGNMKLIEFYVKEFSSQRSFDQNFSKTLFELLIPNDFKSILKQQKNISWKLDDYTAQFPWEMLHDYTTSTEPAFIKTGMIRQLYTDDYQANPNNIENKKAIVINPDYTDSIAFPDLPAAKTEAEHVRNILKNNHFEITELIDAKAGKIINDLFSSEYKIIHISGHGVYEEDKDKKILKSGIVLGDDVLLDPDTIKQLSAIPEFIFINCCYSGKINSQILDERNINRVSLAASIGTQLIKMGVKAAVISGWAVEDSAAKTFSGELYKQLFKGKEFGEAVKIARKECYIKHSNTNTWAAYQCYGEYYYKLVSQNAEEDTKDIFMTESIAKIELENVLSDIRAGNLVKDFEKLKDRIFDSSCDTPEVLELLAIIYYELELFEESLKIIKRVTGQGNINYSVIILELYCRITIQLYDKINIDYKSLDDFLQSIQKYELITFENKKSILFNLYKKEILTTFPIYDENDKTKTKTIRETHFKSKVKDIQKFCSVKNIKNIENYLDEITFRILYGNLGPNKKEISNQLKAYYASNKQTDIKNKKNILNVFRILLLNEIMGFEENANLNDYVLLINRNNFTITELYDELLNLEFLYRTCNFLLKNKSKSQLEKVFLSIKKSLNLN